MTGEGVSDYEFKRFVAYVCYSRCLQDVPLNLLLMKRKAQVTQSNINKTLPRN